MSIMPFPTGRDPRDAIFRGFPETTESPIASVWGTPEISFSHARQNKDFEFYKGFQTTKLLVPEFFSDFFSDKKTPEANSTDDKTTPSVPQFITPSQEVLISLALIALVGASLFIRR